MKPTTPSPPPRRRAGTAWVLLLLAAAGASLAVDHWIRHPHGHFPFEELPGVFGAIGFGASLAGMTLAKIVRPLLRREVTYYDDR